MAKPTVSEAGDIVVAALICGFGIYFWVETSHLSELDVRFPRIVIALIAVLSAQTVVEVVRRVGLRSTKQPPWLDQLNEMVSGRTGVVVLLTLAFVVVLQLVNFYLASFAFVVAVGAVAFGVRRPVILVVDGILIAVAVNLVFEQVLGVRLT